MKKQKSYMEYGQICQKTGHKIGHKIGCIDCKSCQYFIDMITEEVPLCEGSIYTKTLVMLNAK